MNLAKTPEIGKQKQEQEDNGRSTSRSTRRGKKYWKPLRDEAIRQIRKLIIEDSYTPTQVMRELQIPQRTFQRYMHEAFAPERAVLVTSLSNEVMNQLAIMEARLSDGRREVLDAARDPAMDPKRLMAIVSAHHLTEELAVGVFKIHHEAAPGVIKKRAGIT